MRKTAPYTRNESTDDWVDFKSAKTSEGVMPHTLKVYGKAIAKVYMVIVTSRSAIGTRRRFIFASTSKERAEEIRAKEQVRYAAHEQANPDIKSTWEVSVKSMPLDDHAKDMALPHFYLL